MMTLAATARLLIPRLIVQLSFRAGVIGFLLVLSITVRSGFGFSARQAGLVVLPSSIAAAFTSGATATLVGIGALSQAIGTGWSIADGSHREWPGSSGRWRLPA